MSNTPQTQNHKKSIITAENISVNIEKTPVLHALNMRIKKAKHTCIIGPNGAGKTSLLKVLSGEISPSKGTLLIDQQPIKAFKPHQRAQAISVLPQFNPLNFPFNVRDVITLGRIPYKTSTDTNNNIVNTVIDWLDLSLLCETPYSQLSGGQKQRVHIARVLAQCFGNNTTFNGDKKIVLLDEPTSSLDLKHQQHCFTLFKKLQNQGLTIVSVVHDLNLASKMANHIVALKDGKLQFQGTPRTVLTAHNIQALFDVSVNTMMHPLTNSPIISL